MQRVISLAHGAGGAIMHKLIREQFLKFFGIRYGQSSAKIEVGLPDLDDSGIINDIVFTTDSHTVKPLFFPGGDIGTLAIAGTVNDIAVMGAEPLALSSAFVLEEGLSVDLLTKILKSMRQTACKAGVPIITGDTKVVEHGAIDKMFINTSGIGIETPLLEHNLKEVRRYRKFDTKWLKDSNIRAGDKLIISGTVADHGIAILSARDYKFEGNIKSDICPLNKMIAKCLKEGGIVAMKDLTRGGLANALNEWCEKSNIGILIDEAKIPIQGGVSAACEMLGIDALSIGNEGKVIIAVIKEKAEEVLKVLRSTKEGKNAALIGDARKELKAVVMTTTVGGRRIIEPPAGDPVPRIC